MPVGRIGSEFIVNTSEVGNQTQPSIAIMADGGYAIGWTSGSSGAENIMFRVFGPDGAPTGGDRVLTSDTSHDEREVHLQALADGRLLASWTTDAGDDDSGGSGTDAIHTRLWDPYGLPLDNDFVVHTDHPAGDDSSSSSAALADGNVLLAWDGGAGTLYTRPLGSDDQFVFFEGEQALNTASTGAFNPTLVTMASGDVFATWWGNLDDTNDSVDNPSFGLIGRVLNPDGTAAGAEVRVSAVDGSDLPFGIPFTQSLTVLADGTMVATYRENVAGNPLMATLIGADGTPSGVDFTVAGNVGASKVAALADGRFVAAWVTLDNQLEGQVFEADGTRVGDVFQIAEATTPYIDRFDMQSFDDGRFIVSWASINDPDDTSGTGLRAQIFNERLFSGTSEADIWTGGRLSDTIHGAGGDDVLAGGQGNDIISGDEGADTLQGGDGNDTIFGGAGDDVLAGGAGVDRVYANESGDNGDTILVKEGDDATGEYYNGGGGVGVMTALLVEGADGGYDVNLGDDTLVGLGIELLDAKAAATSGSTEGGTGVTHISTAQVHALGFIYDASSASAKTTLQINMTQAGSLSLDPIGITFGGFDRTGHQVLTIGTAGADTIVGQGGNDVIRGGTGHDSLDGAGGSNDTVDYSERKEWIQVTLNGSHTVDVTVESKQPIKEDRIVNFENVLGGRGADKITGDGGDNRLTGNDGNDSLLGAGGSDVLDGGKGNNTLDGGLGADTLIGGDGADRFVFSSALGGGNVDTIQHWGIKDHERIMLDDHIFNFGKGFKGLIPSTAFYAHDHATAGHDANDRIIYDTATGALYYDKDGSGHAAAVEFAVIDSPHLVRLTYGDFQVF